MLKLVHDHLNTKNTCKNAVKKLSFVLIYVSDQYKIQEMCDQVVVSKDSFMLKLPW